MNSNQGHWVHTWASMPMLADSDNLPPDDFILEGVGFRNTTIRQTLRLSIGTEKFLRIRLSNVFGCEALSIAQTRLALSAQNKSGTAEILSSTLQNISFGGSQSITIPAGALIVSDAVNFGFPLQSNTVLSISIFLEAGHDERCITTHPGSRTTSYFTKGNRVSEEDFSRFAVKQTDHWYYISGVEVFAAPDTRVFALIGDSITDGRCSLTNGDTRWPDLLFRRLQATSTEIHTSLAVVNQAAGGNRVMDDGIGPNVLSRLDRDIISLSGVRSVLIFEGVNDIGMAPADPYSQELLSNRLIAAYKQIVTRLRAHGIAIFAATLTPFGLPQTDLKGHGDASVTSYCDPVRESTRQVINKWIRTSGIFDAVVDFDEVLRDPEDHSLLKREYDSGDGLHPNQSAFYAMANSFPIHIFEKLL
ncbi:SGNH hydrolase-type esterase domain-containing protein [Trichoderma chlorosporum]